MSYDAILSLYSWAHGPSRTSSTSAPSMTAPCSTSLSKTSSSSKQRHNYTEKMFGRLEPVPTHNNAVTFVSCVARGKARCRHIRLSCSSWLSALMVANASPRERARLRLGRMSSESQRVVEAFGGQARHQPGLMCARSVCSYNESGAASEDGSSPQAVRARVCQAPAWTKSRQIIRNQTNPDKIQTKSDKLFRQNPDKS